VRIVIRERLIKLRHLSIRLIISCKNNPYQIYAMAYIWQIEYNHSMPNYKGMRVNLLGIPEINSRKGIRIKEKNRKREFFKISFSSPFPESAPKSLIVMYDIPHLQKKERDWLRRHLIRFGYVMIQKSVWVGPSPLPKEFVNYLKEIKIENYCQTFKLASPYDPNRKPFNF